VETDERAIYTWINPAKPPEEVKQERRRMVGLLTVRHGIHDYHEDIWQEWQLVVYQRTQTAPPIPVEQREVFSFGIARNLCRSLLRKNLRFIPLADSSSDEPEGKAGIHEGELKKRRLDQPADSLTRFSEPDSAPTGWVDSERLKNCLQRLRPRTQEVLRKTYEDGKSSVEVGQETGLSAENVRQQLRRSRDEVRNCLNAGRQKGKDSKHAQIHQ
jgi:RNA polymerase sigma factor (sigma-70 family)